LLISLSLTTGPTKRRSTRKRRSPTKRRNQRRRRKSQERRRKRRVKSWVDDYLEWFRPDCIYFLHDKCRHFSCGSTSICQQQLKSLSHVLFLVLVSPRQCHLSPQLIVSDSNHFFNQLCHFLSSSFCLSLFVLSLHRDICVNNHLYNVYIVFYVFNVMFVLDNFML